MKLEISPTPTDDEVAAIVAAVERLRLERQRTKTSENDGAAPMRAEEETQQELPLATSEEASDIEAVLADAIRNTKWTTRSLEPR